jgi:hypothetical protein
MNVLIRLCGEGENIVFSHKIDSLSDLAECVDKSILHTKGHNYVLDVVPVKIGLKKIENGAITDVVGSFNGTKEFVTWATEKSWSKYKDKLIIFKYSGGSKPGNDRFVMVKEVKNGVLHCDDLAANEPRNFSISKISDVRLVKYF